MSTQYETGHAKNIANFQKLIEFVTGYETAYNPSKASLKLTALAALKTSADNALAKVITRNTQYNNKINARMEAFSDLRTLSTRLINALQSTSASEATIDDAKAFNRKIQGKKALQVQPPTDPDTPVPHTISASQMSYDQLIQHFAGLKSVLESEPSYAPNEADLQIIALETKLTGLIISNNVVATAYAAVSNSRIARNQILYTGEDALIKTANEVKKYIKSVFGGDSPQFEQVRKIEFRKVDK